MGLDISAFSRIVRTADVPADGDCDWNTQVIIRTNPSHKERADGLTEGLYESAASFHFRAGSYGDYNHFRDALCRAALDVSPHAIWSTPSAFAGRPFVELIDFSDCEGTIGPTTSAKLAKDFAEYADRVKAILAAIPYATESYDEWRKAFEMAADGGCVDFH